MTQPRLASPPTQATGSVGPEQLCGACGKRPEYGKPYPAEGRDRAELAPLVWAIAGSDELEEAEGKRLVEELRSAPLSAPGR